MAWADIATPTNASSAAWSNDRGWQEAPLALNERDVLLMRQVPESRTRTCVFVSRKTNVSLVPRHPTFSVRVWLRKYAGLQITSHKIGN